MATHIFVNTSDSKLHETAFKPDSAYVLGRGETDSLFKCTVTNYYIKEQGTMTTVRRTTTRNFTICTFQRMLSGGLIHAACTGEEKCIQNFNEKKTEGK